RGKHRPHESRARFGRGPGGRRAGRRPRHDRAPSRRLQQQDRRGRRDPVRRAAPAHRARPRALRRPLPDRAGRAQLQPRRGRGGGPAEGHIDRQAARRHRHHHRAPAVVPDRLRQGAGPDERRPAGLRPARRGARQGAGPPATAGRRRLEFARRLRDESQAMKQKTEQLDPRRAIRRLNILGFATILLLIGGIGGWASTSKLVGAVIAPGTVVVESNIKKVQHPTGGVVGQIFVKEGSFVEEGQIVMRLDDTVTRSTLGVVRSQLDEFTAREARLAAERDDATAIVFPPYLTAAREESSVTMAIAGEKKLFESRRAARAGQRSQFLERIFQLNEEIRGLSAQQAAKESELALVAKELIGVANLYEKNLVSISRYTQLQRDQTRLQGERGQLIADIARARGK